MTVCPDIAKLNRITHVSDPKQNQPILITCLTTANPRSLACVPHLLQLQTKFTKVHMHAITQEDEATIMANFKVNAQLKKLNFSQSKEFGVTALFEQANKTAQVKITTTPQSFIFGKDGKLIWFGEPQDHLCELYLSKLDD